VSAAVRLSARQGRRAGQPCALVNAATNSLIALRTLVSAEIHHYAERPQLPRVVGWVRAWGQSHLCWIAC
jgi:hypothetical protein